MRVLHVVASGRRRGAEIFAGDLVGALDDAGVTQHVAVLRDRESSVEFGAPVTQLAAHGSNGNGWDAVPFDPGTLRRLRAIVRSWSPDVVQAHGGEPLKYAVAATMAGTAPPVVYRRIGTAPQEIVSGPRRAAYGWLMRRASRVVAVADVLRREVIRTFRVPAGRVVTIPNGVDARRLLPVRGRDETRRTLGLPADAPVLLALGALVWEKDPMTQLEIAERIARTSPKAVFLMVGDGPLRERVRVAIADRGLEDRVRMLGARDDVADILAASDALLFASCSEGMAASVIEAGMAGLPVAAFAVGGIPEVIEDGVTGVLAAPGDVERLTAAALRLLEDAPHRASIGGAAKEASVRFDIHDVGRRYLAVYERLLEAR